MQKHCFVSGKLFPAFGSVLPYQSVSHYPAFPSFEQSSMASSSQSKGHWPWNLIFRKHPPREAHEGVPEDHSPGLARSFRFSKDHRLHTLPLCENCNSLTRERLTQVKAYNLLRNCYDLIGTSKRCRLCAFIAQSLLNREGQSLQTRFIQWDDTISLETPLSLLLKDDYLEVILGNSNTDQPVAELFEHNEPSTV